MSRCQIGSSTRLEQLDDPAPVRVRQAAGEVAVRGVEHDADRDRLAVAQLVVRELLELVRRPVPEVERPRRPSSNGSPLVAMWFRCSSALRCTSLAIAVSERSLRSRA